MTWLTMVAEAGTVPAKRVGRVKARAADLAAKRRAEFNADEPSDGTACLPYFASGIELRPNVGGIV